MIRKGSIIVSRMSTKESSPELVDRICLKRRHSLKLAWAEWADRSFLAPGRSVRRVRGLSGQGRACRSAASLNNNAQLAGILVFGSVLVNRIVLSDGKVFFT